MSETFNVYCDESCHLDHDHQKAMVPGAVWCPLDETREYFAEGNTQAGLLAEPENTRKGLS